MTTTWYELGDHETASVQVGGEWVYGTEFEVSCAASILLSEAKAPDGALKLGRTVHEAMGTSIAKLREEVAEVTAPYVSVLVRTPLTVLSADCPPRLVTKPCEACPACVQGDECENPLGVMNLNGTSMVLPGTLGYHAFVIVAVVGSESPPGGREHVAGEPWWMTIPDFDPEAWSGELRSGLGRVALIDSLLPRRPPPPDGEAL